MNVSIFNCAHIFNDDKLYMVSDMSIPCWVGSHRDYAYHFGIPTIIIWLIGLPVITYMYLGNKRHALHQN